MVQVISTLVLLACCFALFCQSMRSNAKDYEAQMMLVRLYFAARIHLNMPSDHPDANIMRVQLQTKLVEAKEIMDKQYPWHYGLFYKYKADFYTPLIFPKAD